MIKIDEEFDELKSRWENFISRFSQLAPQVYGHKGNVFCELVSSSRPKKAIVEMARETRPFVSSELFNLMDNYLQFMMKLPGVEGANYRSVYRGMSPAGLIKRLLTKRPFVFFKGSDHNVLRDDPLICRPGGKRWNQVAMILDKKDEGQPYLQEYISYDEMLLSSCVNMSTPTFYVSDGSLKNPQAKPTKPFIPEGILCGIVGARLTKVGFMEHRFVFPRDDNNKNFNDVHHSDVFWIENVFQEAFPEGKIPTFDEIRSKPDVYREIYKDGINLVYFKKRLGLSIIPFIKEAEARGIEKKRQIVASVPGIGAGVWRGTVASQTIHSLIVNLVLEYFDNDFDLKNLAHLVGLFLPKTDQSFSSSFKPKKQISSITTNSDNNTILVAFKGHEDTITIFNQSRYVAQLLPENFQSCLTVSAYAWDGNSYPGNEYWIDFFGSFDPQAILCSLLGQFQNPDVNVQLSNAERIKIY